MLSTVLLTASGKVTTEEAPTATSITIDEDAVYDILSNERRRRCLKLLSGSDEQWEVSQLSEQVATDIADTDADADDIYDSVYISLCQTHLPKLDEADLVVYDSTAKTVTSGPAMEALHRYWFPAEIEDESADTESALVLVASTGTLIALGLQVLVSAFSGPIIVAIAILHLVVLWVTGFQYFDVASR